ncbi:MAG: GTPase Era [Flavobacteriales bacterium]|nr:GTPase Era [Flavobacteriales bacterium]|tara:strand:+ start:4716 stop:5588 length:873 start_codon:yes stop_codon:yes gene_type:complete
MEHKSGFVNIIGSPNVGKSTLMNSLLGQKISIITSKAQTTRHRILGILNDSKYQIIFSDTPGVITPSYKLQENMMHYVYSSFKDADIILYMLEFGSKKLKDKKLISILRETQLPLFILLNKIDLSNQSDIENEINRLKSEFSPDVILPISALNNFNLDSLIECIIDFLPISPAYYDKNQITDRSERFFVEEIIREKILKHYKQEIPYSVQVKVDSFVEANIVKIVANIFVMRESQKRIIIGHKGLGIKRIGVESRKDIEKMLGKHVFLETPVKIKKDWRNSKKELKKFGY